MKIMNMLLVLQRQNDLREKKTDHLRETAQLGKTLFGIYAGKLYFV